MAERRLCRILELQRELVCFLQASTTRKRILNNTEDESEEEGEHKKERIKRGRFMAVKEERKNSSEVVVEVRVLCFPQQKIFVRCLQSWWEVANQSSLLTAHRQCWGRRAGRTEESSER